MTLVVDAGALYAQADRDDPDHGSVTETLRAETGDLVTTAYVVAEADHLVLNGLGVDAELALLEDLVAGTYAVHALTTQEHRQAAELVRRYRDLRIGLADASLVVLAKRLGSRRILTLDERDFRAIEPLQGGAFHILPADG